MLFLSQPRTSFAGRPRRPPCLVSHCPGSGWRDGGSLLQGLSQRGCLSCCLPLPSILPGLCPCCLPLLVSPGFPVTLKSWNLTPGPSLAQPFMLSPQPCPEHGAFSLESLGQALGDQSWPLQHGYGALRDTKWRQELQVGVSTCPGDRDCWEIWMWGVGAGAWPPEGAAAEEWVASQA